MPLASFEPLVAAAGVADDPITRRLIEIGSQPVGKTRSGHPYLRQDTWELLRDRVPLLFGMGQRVLETADRLEELARGSLDEERAARFCEAMRVVRQVTRTAAITAPPDLWLLRNVLAAHAELGLPAQLVAGEPVYAKHCVASGARLDPLELETDLRFLRGRGLVEAYDECVRAAGHPRALAILRLAAPRPEGHTASATPRWRRLFSGDALSAEDRRVLEKLGTDPPCREDPEQNHWIPTAGELELGYRLLPVVLALRAQELTAGLEAGAVLRAGAWPPGDPALAAGARRILVAAGWLASADGGAGAARAAGDDGDLRVTLLGARGFARGPGPFGIIETYHPYLDGALRLLREGAGAVWVKRGENVAASQDANRPAFERANDALDRFCDDTGFRYGVFIEHAVGRGEATRIRFERSGEDGLRYFGADLEDDAIDAAVEEQRAGRLPQGMRFVRRADIGEPEVLARALREDGADPEREGGVMMVGNGFHEVRDQTRDGMVEVFRGYERLGLVLLFTEENALTVDDMRATAWNTYHAGFRYVHEKSGQVLRPDLSRPPSRGGHLLRASWDECARAAGYVRADTWCSRSRTIYPYPTRDGHNPAISHNLFFVPRRLAERLGIATAS